MSYIKYTNSLTLHATGPAVTDPVIAEGILTIFKLPGSDEVEEIRVEVKQECSV